MNPAAVVDYGKYGGAPCWAKASGLPQPPFGGSHPQGVEWFAADASHNIVYTYHNAKHDRDVYMVAAGRGRYPDRLLREA